MAENPAPADRPDPTPDPAPKPDRGYVFEGGRDIVLTLEAPNIQFFDGPAINDPEELARVTTRPPE